MIKHRFKLKRRFWKTYVYFNVTYKDVQPILHKMKLLNMPKSYIQGAYTMINRSLFNTGATYSNITTKTSVVIFLKTTNAKEFTDSFIHEILHLSNHIARAYNLNVDGEEICYIAGDIGKHMFDECHKLLCDCCNSNKDIDKKE